MDSKYRKKTKFSLHKFMIQFELLEISLSSNGYVHIRLYRHYPMHHEKTMFMLKMSCYGGLLPWTLFFLNLKGVYYQTYGLKFKMMGMFS